MLLMLEKWPSPTRQLELAMLLDESPMHDSRAMNAGEPWRPDSALTAAARSVDLKGHAWLYAVFLKDPASTWGSKMVKLLAGGLILRKDITPAGVWTGKYTTLRYEVVARHVFRNIVGKDYYRYRVIKEMHMELSDKADSDTPEEQPAAALPPPDPVLGPAIPQVKDAIAFLPDGGAVGCLFRYESEKGKIDRYNIIIPRTKDKDMQERMTALDLFLKRRFYLIEYQRRPFVQIIMGRLGFVRMGEDEEGGRRPRLEDVCCGHVQNVAMSVEAIVNAATSGAFRDSKPEH